ncbi:MAG: SGNH/GDSL hydrolase family protein [Candidatus Sumerlaeaceae bacterium]|nr:SGNH/GDSL hydrolase family protein [Candidatus Sumerlaeaceae bacterium]
MTKRFAQVFSLFPKTILLRRAGVICLSVLLCLLLPAGLCARTANFPPGLAPLPADKATSEPGSDMLWFDAVLLQVEGRGWTDTQTPFERLPARMEGKATTAVWNLSKNTAGICVRFVTDSPTIAAAWDGGTGMNHMAFTGSHGLDLYERRGREWVYRGTGRPQATRTTATVASNLPPVPTEYMLYLPLYARVTELKVAVAPGARIAPAAARPARRKPIVFYGTSITQGGCASRAGMCHPAILGRWLDREVINLGFSGSGKMEPELAELFGELDPALFVLETLPNMNLELVQTRVEPFVRILRKHRPRTPILLVENPLLARDNPLNAALRKARENLEREGLGPLYLLPADGQLAGKENGTVDGVHPTDLGFLRMAECYLPVLQRILRQNPD